MNVVDSSAWLEYFAEGPNAEYFAGAIEDTENLVVPTLSLYEVFKRIVQQRSEADALQATAVMLQGMVADLTAGVALDAARLSLGSSLPLADAVMLATARARTATFWTQDSHFEGMAGVKYPPAETRKTGGGVGTASGRRRRTG